MIILIQDKSFNFNFPLYFNTWTDSLALNWYLEVFSFNKEQNFIYSKITVFHFSLSAKFGRKRDSNYRRAVFMSFYIFILKICFIKFSYISEEVKTKSNFSRQNWRRYLLNIWRFNTVSFHHKWNRPRLIKAES